MQKKSIEFIQSIIKSEKEVFDSGGEDSILHTIFWKNLFCVFKDKEDIKKYMIHCSQNKITL